MREVRGVHCGRFCRWRALLLALVDDRLLNAYIGNRDVFWLTASLGAVLATSRAFIVEENVAFEPNLAMARVVAHTHHFPKHWRKSAHKLEVKMNLRTNFSL